MGGQRGQVPDFGCLVHRGCSQPERLRQDISQGPAEAPRSALLFFLKGIPGGRGSVGRARAGNRRAGGGEWGRGTAQGGGGQSHPTPPPSEGLLDVF